MRKDAATRFRITEKPVTRDWRKIIDAISEEYASWQEVIKDDAAWRERAKNNGRLRTWWLRWKLRHSK